MLDLIGGSMELWLIKRAVKALDQSSNYSQKGNKGRYISMVADHKQKSNIGYHYNLEKLSVALLLLHLMHEHFAWLIHFKNAWHLF